MSFIRITSGKLKGRKVRTPDGMKTRPLLTRIRKSLADVLRPRFPGARVLDLFGGSGAIAFEFLSNGAATAMIVELKQKTVELIRQNAKDLDVSAYVEIIQGDGIQVLNRLAGQSDEFNIVMVSPPYGMGLQQQVLEAPGISKILAANGLIVLQRESRENALEAPRGLCFRCTRIYGRTVFDFYEQVET